MKEFERNEELARDFIQGWYMSDNIVTSLLKEVKQMQYEKKFVSIGKPGNYQTVDLRNHSIQVQKQFLNSLNNMVLNYEKVYFSLNHLDYKLNEYINIQHWEPGKSFANWHCETSNCFKTIFRNLVFMTYLNDIHDGGDTEFFYQKCKIKPKAGLTILWPAGWTHLHRGNVTNEHKYAITGWFENIPRLSLNSYCIPDHFSNSSEYG